MRFKLSFVCTYVRAYAYTRARARTHMHARTLTYNLFLSNKRQFSFLEWSGVLNVDFLSDRENINLNIFFAQDYIRTYRAVV